MSSSLASSSTSLTLEAKTAADLMTPRVVTIPQSATLPEAVAILKKERISAAPVCDELGNAVGVLSRSDLIAHDGEQVEYLQPHLEKYKQDGFVVRLRDGLARALHIEKNGGQRVKDFMTRVVFSVGRETAASTVIDAMLSLVIHRIFVTDSDGEIVGVISATDVIRHLHPMPVAEVKQPEGDDGPCL